MVAESDLDDDTVICSVEPFAFAVAPQWRSRCCGRCGTVDPDGAEFEIMCEACCAVRYCSHACQALHASEGGPGSSCHHLVCSALAQLSSVIAYPEHQHWLTLLVEVFANAALPAPPPRKGRIAFDDLQHHPFSELADARAKQWSASFAHFRALAREHSWCPWRDDLASAPDDASLYARLSRIVSNAFGFSSHGDGSSTPQPQQPQQQCCAGVYPDASIFNHSCRPTCTTTTGAHRLLIATNQDVRRGAELTISYIDARMGVGERRRHLWDTYNFACACERCETEGGPAATFEAAQKPAAASTAAADVDEAAADAELPLFAVGLADGDSSSFGEALQEACDASNLDSRGTVDAAAPMITWTHNGVSVCVEQQQTLADTAALVWVDSLALARYLGGGGVPLGRTLELGCGTGALGIWLAKAGLASCVGVADRPSRLPYARANVARNGLTPLRDGADNAADAADAMRVHALAYGDLVAARRLRGAYDTCVAAALVYDRALHAPLVETLAALRPPRLILCNSAWNPDAMGDFMELLGTHFGCTHVHRVPADHGLGGGGYAVDVWECAARDT
jgi:predicted nicotinamide N-methyase